ncbi:hypothetical protein [Actinomadura geliboluensis]|uniref:Uncharacterized protein n=1 Tax=Actinomadura geliboluensis TaxID=882440 RepID=A0A5S4G926_9ACTN|nr:hypothetical protein [Actinomadura geliboluensis]TMR28951.1 hypothetical protein ETD96_36530 [Actinomadura geliboluensis]
MFIRDRPYAEAPYEPAPYAEPAYDERYDERYEEPYGEPYEAVPPPRPGGRGPKRPGKAKRQGRPEQAKRPKRPAQAGEPAAPGGLAGRVAALGPKLYFGAAAALGVLVLIGLAAVVVFRDGNGPAAGNAANAKIGKPAGNGPSPTSYSSSPSTSAYGGIAARGSDPEPLTAAEAFPADAATLAVPDGEVKVKLRAKRLDADCAAAVWGGSVGAELGKGGCTQAARGIYSDPKRGYGLAVTVFNLNSSADADRFVARLEHTIGAGFVRPLEAPEPLDDFGRGFGMARGLAMGHFAVVSWAERLDGKGTETDETLLSLLIEGGKSPAVLGRAARASE